MDKRGKHENHTRGKKHHRWNDGKIKDSLGYVLVRAGASHPLSCPNGYVREHLLVLASALGIEAVAGKVAHHKNGNKADNRLENLALISREEHNRIHNKENERDDKGRFIGGKHSEQMP